VQTEGDFTLRRIVFLKIDGDFRAEMKLSSAKDEPRMLTQLCHAPGVTLWCNSREEKSSMFPGVSGLTRTYLASGGEGGIRTHGTLASTPHFECGTFNHSATSPRDHRAISPTG